ncbi:carbohydrate kinase family protein [Caulobacter segnis]
MDHLNHAPPSLTIIGDVAVDLVLGPVTGWPKIGTETIMQRSELRAGGSGGNTALAMRHLGAPCRLLSQVGGDTFGGWLAEEFKGLDAQLGVTQTATTISTGVIHDCGERTFFTTKGHLEAQSWDEMRPRLGPPPAPGSIALLTGVFLLPRMRETYAQVLDDLSALGYQIAIDTGWPPEGWTFETRAATTAWLTRCDHILLNEIEIKGLAGVEDLDDALLALAPMMRPDATLVAKTGAKGAVATYGGARFKVAAPPIAVFDTIGAGDSFNAGYLAAKLSGLGVREALDQGCRTASAVIGHFPRQSIAPGQLAALAVTAR